MTSESVPDGFEKRSGPGGLSSMKLKSENGAPKNSSPNQLAYNYWYTTVEVYSAKQPTNEFDKLVAISGLARALHKSRWVGKLFHEAYDGGLWLEDLARGLICFHNLETSTRSQIKLRALGLLSWPVMFLPNELSVRSALVYTKSENKMLLKSKFTASNSLSRALSTGRHLAPMSNKSSVLRTTGL